MNIDTHSSGHQFDAPRKTQWYALGGNGDMIGLGPHEDFEDAVSTEHGRNAGWVIDEEGARDWLISLAILLGATIEFKEQQ